MSKDISSSEDEDVRRESAPPPAQIQRKNAKYQCPPDFVSFSQKTCSGVLSNSLNDSNTELWLIKAPSNFDPQSFRNLKIPLSGLHTLQATAASEEEGSGQIYSVLAGQSGTDGLRLLTRHGDQPDKPECGPVFSGLLNVCESYGDVSANLVPQAIPAAPAPTIPLGLRQRFQPFGSKTPTLSAAAQEAIARQRDSKPAPPVARPERDEERKRRKRERSMLTEEEEVKEEVKEEPVDEALEETAATEERRKKKKKKKDKDRREGEGPIIDDLGELCRSAREEVEVKPEPLDCSYGDVEDSGKKKKKKKKSKHDHD